MAPYSYRDLKIPKTVYAVVGIAVLDSDTAILADRFGEMHLFSLHTGEVRQSCLQYKEQPTTFCTSLSLDSRRQRCVLASRSAEVILWDTRTNSPTIITPKHGGPVSATAFSPCGEHLAIGVGWYPLNPRNTSEARIEVWALGRDESPVFQQATALPGVNVDQIAWNTFSEEIIAVVGCRDQQRGYLVRLDRASLRANRCHLIPHCMVRHIAVVPPGDHLLVTSHRKVCRLALDADYLGEEWTWESDRKIVDACVNEQAREVLLSTGQLLDLDTCEPRGGVYQLPHCTAVVTHPDVGYVGAGGGQIGRTFCDATDNPDATDEIIVRVWERARHFGKPAPSPGEPAARRSSVLHLPDPDRLAPPERINSVGHLSTENSPTTYQVPWSVLDSLHVNLNKLLGANRTGSMNQALWLAGYFYYRVWSVVARRRDVAMPSPPHTVDDGLDEVCRAAARFLNKRVGSREITSLVKDDMRALSQYGGELPMQPTVYAWWYSLLSEYIDRLPHRVNKWLDLQPKTIGYIRLMFGCGVVAFWACPGGFVSKFGREIGDVQCMFTSADSEGRNVTA